MKKTSKYGRYITIDVGSTSIKAVKIEITDKGKRLIAIEEEKFSSPLTGKDDESNTLKAVDALKSLMKRLSPSKSDFISAVYSSRDTQVKIIDLPGQIRGEQLDKTLVWEAKKILAPAFKDEPFSFVYKVLKSNPYSVALVAVPVTVLRKFVHIFKEAGVKLKGIFPEVFSGIYLRKMADLAGLPAVSIINVGYVGTHVQIYSAGELKFYRYIPSALAEMSDIPSSDELDVFSQKIRFSFDYFRAVSKLSQIDLMCLMGGGMAVPGLAAYEQAYFAPTKVSGIDISSEIDISSVFTNLSGDTSDKQTKLAKFIPAVGVTLAAAETDSLNMNLFAKALLRAKAETNKKIMRLVPFVIGIIILAIGLVMSYNKRQKSLEFEKTAKIQIAAVESEIASYTTSLGKIKKYDCIHLSPGVKRVIGSEIEKDDYVWPLFKIKHLAAEMNISVSEILIKNNDEAEIIHLPDDSKGIIQANNEDLNPYLSSMSQNEMGQQDFNASLSGRVVIIKGLVNSMNGIGDYAARLVKDKGKDATGKIRRTLVRINAIEAQKKASKFIFLLKGELP